MSKWQEYCVLIDNDTKEEIRTSKIFDETIEKVQKERRATSVLFLCQPKYTFHVTDEVIHNIRNNKMVIVNDDLSLHKMIENCTTKQEQTKIFL